MPGTACQQVQNIGNASPLVQNLQGLPVKATPGADFTGDEDIGKKVHFDPDDTVSRTGLTAPTLYIEGESSRLESPYPGFGKLSKEIPGVIE